jgi:hypothetical protein
MRKLAREAVIFMLLTPLVLATGAFIYLRATIPAPFDMSKAKTLDEISAGHPPCKWLDPNDKRRVWVQDRNDPCMALDMSQEISIPGLPPSETTSEVLGDASIIGILGLPTGLGLWILYRLIRFAIKG